MPDSTYSWTQPDLAMAAHVRTEGSDINDHAAHSAAAIEALNYARSRGFRRSSSASTSAGATMEVRTTETFHWKVFSGRSSEPKSRLSRLKPRIHGTRTNGSSSASCDYRRGRRSCQGKRRCDDTTNRTSQACGPAPLAVRRPGWARERRCRHRLWICDGRRLGARGSGRLLGQAGESRRGREHRIERAVVAGRPPHGCRTLDSTERVIEWNPPRQRLPKVRWE